MERLRVDLVVQRHLSGRRHQCNFPMPLLPACDPWYGEVLNTVRWELLSKGFYYTCAEGQWRMGFITPPYPSNSNPLERYRVLSSFIRGMLGEGSTMNASFTVHQEFNLWPAMWTAEEEEKQVPKMSKSEVKKRLANKYMGEAAIECSICLDKKKVKKCAKLSCSHTFHQDCIAKWLVNKAQCPYCRSKFE